MPLDELDIPKWRDRDYHLAPMPHQLAIQCSADEKRGEQVASLLMVKVLPLHKLPQCPQNGAILPACVFYTLLRQMHLNMAASLKNTFEPKMSNGSDASLADRTGSAFSRTLGSQEHRHCNTGSRTVIDLGHCPLISHGQYQLLHKKVQKKQDPVER